MPIALIQVTENPVASIQTSRAGLVHIAYDEDHEVVWFECVDPLCVVSNVPERIRGREYGLSISFSSDVELEMEKSADRIKKMLTPEIEAQLEKSFKLKLLGSLKEKFETDTALLNQESSNV